MVDLPNNDHLVVSIHLNRYEVKQVLIDMESLKNLLTFEVFSKLGLNKESLTMVLYSLVVLGDKIVVVQEMVNLSFVLGDEKYKR